jgi:hypothetical protein
MLSAALVLLLLNKPICNKHTQGKMWPEAANNDKSALLTLARSGALEICVSTSWGYRWEHPTVHIHQAPSTEPSKNY